MSYVENAASARLRHYIRLLEIDSGLQYGWNARNHMSPVQDEAGTQLQVFVPGEAKISSSCQLLPHLGTVVILSQKHPSVFIILRGGRYHQRDYSEVGSEERFTGVSYGAGTRESTRTPDYKAATACFIH